MSDQRVDVESIGSPVHHRRSAALLVIAGAVAAGATWIATRHGPGISPDSVTYLSAARNLFSGHGYTDFTGQPLTNFPPGFPAALAAGHGLGFSFTTSARVINAASFAAIVALAWVLLRRRTSSNPVRVGATLLVATSPALVRVADNVWSEPMFCAFVLAFLVALEDATRLKVDHRNWWLALAGLLAAIAFFVRYAAVALVIVGVIVIVASSRREVRRVLLGRLAIFLGAAASLPTLWVLRNASAGARSLLGPRIAAHQGLLYFAGRFFGTFLSLFPSSSVPRFVVLGSVAALVVVAMFTFTLERAGERTTTAGPATLITFVVVYAVLVIASGKLAGASVNARIDSPIYVPVVVVAVGLFDRSLRCVRQLQRPRWRRPATFVLVAAAVGYLGLSGLTFAGDAWADGRTARGYTPRKFESPLFGAVELVRPGATIATNSPWALYTATNRQPIVPSPGQAAPELAFFPETVRELVGQACAGPVYLAWFTNDGVQWPYPRSELAETVNLEVVARFSEGVLYAVHPRTMRCPDR